MHISSQSLRIAAWSVFAVYTANADHIIENLSFGYQPGHEISPNYRNIPHFAIKGTDDYEPQVLSDRVILTPPYPGNKRASIWAVDPLHHKGDWTAQFDFRATGMERGGGNLQFWYVKDSQAGEPPSSLFTAPKFDGLVLLIDQYEGHGGSIRGFLNDGTKDIKAHPDPDTLAFGKCDYAYRNRGELTPVKLHHTEEYLEVVVDGALCFKTDKVKLPEGYYFGISASSAENPDSFEVFKFIVSTANSHRETPPSPSKKDYVNSQKKKKEEHKQNQHHNKHGYASGSEDEEDIDDVAAATIRDQQEQFADLHNRIQILNHHLNTIINRVYDTNHMLEEFQKKDDERWEKLMQRIVPMDDRGAATMRNVEKVERSTAQILRDLESKDFKEMMNQIHRALDRNQEGVMLNLPDMMGAVITHHGPSMTTFLFMAVAVQLTITGAYILYKKRRENAPKKYL